MNIAHACVRVYCVLQVSGFNAVKRYGSRGRAPGRRRTVATEVKLLSEWLGLRPPGSTSQPALAHRECLSWIHVAMLKINATAWMLGYRMVEFYEATI